MSTTIDVSVAISYAIKKGTHSHLLFRFVTRNNLERGADVQWPSMFPGESCPTVSDSSTVHINSVHSVTSFSHEHKRAKHPCAYTAVAAHWVSAAWGPGTSQAP
jgi:hypothetical protein